MRRIALMMLVCLNIMLLTSYRSVGSDSTSALQDPEPILVEGHERLTWEISADAQALAGFDFIAYVNDVPNSLRDVTCGETPGPDGFTCSSPLPSLTDGANSIQVAAYDRNMNVEGQKSATMHVRLRTAAGDVVAGRTWTSTASDGLEMSALVVADGLIDATDLSVLPDGRVLIAERSGQVRLFNGQASNPPVAGLVPEVMSGDGRGLLALAVDADVDRTQAVYAVYTSPSGGRLMRLQLSGTDLRAPAILLDGLPMAPSSPSAALEIGPDAKLYLALDDGGAPERAGDLGSFNAKVLRLNTDGTTPPDQAALSPVFVTGPLKPAGIAWQRGSSVLWAVGTDVDRAQQLYSLTSEGPPYRGRIVAQKELPSDAGVTDVLLYDAEIQPALRHHLLVAGAKGGLLRIPPSASGLESESLLSEPAVPFRGLGLTSDGAIYALTPRVLIRITISEPRR